MARPRKKTTVTKQPTLESERIRVQKAMVDFGEVETLDSEDVGFHIDHYVPTGCLGIDELLGRGTGIPSGRIIEIYGQEHSGKTTLLDHIFAQAQKMGGLAVLIDTERAHAVDYAASIGVDPKKLWVITPDPLSLEQTFRCLNRFLQQGLKYRPLVIGLDSISSVPTETQIEAANAGVKIQPADAARCIAQWLGRNLPGPLAAHDASLIIVNHEYDNIGGSFTYKKTYGGNALPKIASIRLRMTGGKGKIEKKGVPVGKPIQVLVKKSKIAGVTNSVCEVGLIHGKGFDNTWTLFEGLKAKGYITQSGAWASLQMPGEEKPRKWQQKHFGLQEICQKEPELLAKLVEIYQDLYPPVTPETEDEMPFIVVPPKDEETKDAAV